MPVTGVKSYWSSGNLIFAEKVAGCGNYVQFGASGDGMDMKWFGDTAANYMLWDTSANQLVFSGTAVTQAMGANANTSGSGTALSVSRTAALRVYGDDGGTALTPSGSVPDIRVALGRMLITANQSAVHARAWGVMGYVTIYDALYSEEQTGGVNGVLEAWQSAGTVTLGGYGISAGVTGTFATAGTTLVDTNHVSAGVAAIANIKGTCTQTGKVCAFYVGKYNTSQWSDATSRANWSYGLYIPTATTTYPIQIGTWISNTASTGHVLSNTSATSGTSPAVGIYCDDGGAAITSSITTPLFARYLLTVDQSSGATQTALYAQLKSAGSGTRTYNTGGIRGAYVFTQLAATTLSGNAELVTINAATSLAGTMSVGASAMWAGLDVNLAGSQTISVTSGGVAAGVVIRAKSAETCRWPIGLYIPSASCDKPIQLGVWSSATASVGHVLTATNNYAVALNCDDGGAAITSSITTPLFSRYLLTASQSSGATQTAFYSQLKSYGSLTFNTGGIRAAYIFNQAGTITLSGNAEYVGINQATTLAGTMTVGASAMWAGIDINLAGSGTASVTAGGVAAGLVVRSKSAEAARWPFGIYIPTGSVDKFFYGATTLTGASTTTRNMVDLEVTDATTNSGGYQRGLYINWASSGAKTGSAEINAIGADINLTANVTYAYGLSLYFSQTGNPTAYSSAISVYMDNMGTAATNLMCADFQLAQTSVISGGARFYFIRVRDQGTQKPTAVLGCEGANAATYLLYTDANAGNGFVNTGGAGTCTVTGGWVKLAINVNGTTYYIPAGVTLNNG